MPLAAHARESVWGHPVVVRAERTDPWNSDVSTGDTVASMQRLAHEYAMDPVVAQATAAALCWLRADASDRDMAGAIFWWVRRHVTFVQDEQLMYEQLGVAPQNLDKELLIPPPVLLRMPVPMGDCDDFSLLIASMALAIGLRPYFVTVAADAQDPQKFSHIYVAVWLEDEQAYLPLDAGNRLEHVPPGWEAGKVSRKAIWRV